MVVEGEALGDTQPTSPDISNNGETNGNGKHVETAVKQPSTNKDNNHESNAPPKPVSHLKSQSDPAIQGPDDEDDKEPGEKGQRRNRRRFVVNQRGFMGVQSMVTAKLVDEYQLLQVLGQGFYGKVYLGTSVNTSNGETVAIKQLDERKFQKEQFESISAEFHTLHKIIHPNIVPYKRIILDDNVIYVVTEFVDNGSILDVIQKTGPIPESTVVRYVKQILNALAHLQDLKIVHRNLKCSNVLVAKNGDCKITDFELSHKHESNRYTIRGAPYWMAPEVIEMTATPTCASDIWGLGCMIIEMLTAEPPYRKLGPMSALLSISRDEHPPLPDGISDYLKHFLGHCFAKNPDVRHDAKTLKKHPWIMQAPEGPPTPTAATSPLSNHAMLPISPRRFPTSKSTENISHASPAPTPQSASPPSTSPLSPPVLPSSHSPPHPATPLSPPAQPPQQTQPAQPAHPAQPAPPAHPAQPAPPAQPAQSTPQPAQISAQSHTATSPAATPPSPTAHLPGARATIDGQNIVIDVYSEKDKEDFDLLEMTTTQEHRNADKSIDDLFPFQKAAFAPTPGQSELAALKAEIQYLRALNDKNFETAQQLKEQFKKDHEVQQRLIDLSWRLRERSDTAMDNIRQAAKATGHSNMLLKRTNQVATEALAHGAIVTSNTRKLEEYILEGDPAGKKLMSIVFKKTVTVESLVNPTISGMLWYNSNLKIWKKDKEKRAWFVLKDNFLFAFKTDKGSTSPSEVVYLGDGARLTPMSEDQCKKKFCFKLGDLFLVATETAELCSEWMLALSKPQKWYESSYEDTPLSPRSAARGKEENGVTPAALSESSTALSPPSTPSTPSNLGKNSTKGRRGSNPPPPNNTALPVFGVSIEELFAREGGNVPYFFARMIQFLEEKGLQEEGLLRLSGSLSVINQLKDALQHGEDVDYTHHDPHTVTGLLKAFFRELPVPIIPEPYHSRILEVMFNQDVMEDQRVVEVKMILDQLPTPNRSILKVLMNFLVKVNCNADKNKMTIQNLITCMVPTLRCVPGVFMYVIPNYDFVFDVE